MISKKKGMVLLFAVLMTTSMMLPLALNPKTEAAGLAPVPESSSMDVINNWVDRLNSDSMGEETVDSLLASYMETGEIDSNVVKSRKGEISVLLYYDPDVSSDAIREFATIDWVMNVKLLKVALVKVGTVADMKGLSKLPGLRYMSADEYTRRETTDYNGGYDDISTDMYEIRKLVGADTAYSGYGYNGTGIRIGIDDNAVDFSLPDLEDAMAVDSNGLPESYDPSGYSITTMTIANNTAVSNVTEWLGMGYLLTYESGGKYYLNTTGWDPIVTDTGYTWDYMLGYFFDAYMNGRDWSDTWDAFWQDELWLDWEIPAPTADNYTAGWVFQRQITDDGYSRRFAPALVMDKTDIIIDFNTSMAFTLAHNMQRYGKPDSINFSLQADKDFILDMCDWSFVDDKNDGYVFNVDADINAGNVIVADTDNDLEVDWGLGGMCWAWDNLGLFEDIINATEPNMYTEVPLFQGIAYDGRAFAIMFPQSDAHGVWVAAAAASRGVFDHDVHGTGVTKTLPGIAPGATIIASDDFSDGSTEGAAFWSAGYHLQADGNWTYTGQHQANISSNSWGFTSDVIELTYLGLVWDAVSAPGFIHPSAGGTLFVTSAGNDGADYMSSGPFATSPSVVAVGASMATHFYDEDGAFGPNLLDSPQVIDFSSNGPQFMGMVKPEVVAPGFVGYNPNPSLQYALGGDSFYGWTGTSLACPIAAGVAAIIWEAVADVYGVDAYTPELVAQILQSSATDLGLDAFVQGNGLVNATAAIDAIDAGVGDDVYFSNTDSFDAWSALMTPTWMGGWSPANGSAYDVYIGDIKAPPIGRGLTSLFFGQVSPGETVTLDVTATDYGGGNVADTEFTDSAWFYEMAYEYTFTVDTFKYNETQPLDDWAVWDGVFNLTDKMGDAAWTNFLAADYATVSASFDAAAGIDRLRFFDWNDTLEDDIFNHYNSTAPVNDYIKFVGQSMSGLNNMFVRLADPLTLDNLFDYSLGLYIRDADSTLAATGNTVNITITIWKTTPDGQIHFGNHATGDMNVTLDVDAGAEPGIHQGYLTLERGGYTHNLPYSYNVEFNFNGADGVEVPIISGAGTYHEPFDNGIVMPNDNPGWRVIPINIANSSPTFNKTTLVFRVTWEEPGTVVDFRLTDDDDTYFGVFETEGAQEATQNTYIHDAGVDMTGNYYLMIQATAWDGNMAYEEITVSLQAYDGITDATYDVTWTALDSTTPAAFADAAELEGDHINITSVWDLTAVTGLPEYAITSSEISLLSGLFVVRTGTCADPGGLDTWPISIALTDNYVWETIDGINAGEEVRVYLDVGHSDASFDAYMWDDANEDDVIDADELGGVLVSVDDGGSDAPEAGSFIAPSTGTVAIRVFVWAWAFTPGDTYSLEVDTRVSLDVPNVEGVAGTTWYDTYDLDRNALMGLVFTGYTDTNVVFSDEFIGVDFTNFFAPELSNLVVTGDGAVKTITWDNADRNSLEVQTFEVLMSDDEGDTWQLLSAGSTTTGYTWDSTGFYIDEYTVQIRVSDETGLTDVLDSSLFDAGTLERPEPPTPTPTTPPPVVDPNFVLWIGLIGGIGVGVVVILILFLVKKR